jgi:hypothetical protein
MSACRVQNVSNLGSAEGPDVLGAEARNPIDEFVGGSLHREAPQYAS